VYTSNLGGGWKAIAELPGEGDILDGYMGVIGYESLY
jgi:hypothetical protein